MSASANHRHHPRVPLTVEVTLESEHNFYTGLTDNISEGGLFISLPNPPAVGAEVGIELVLGEQRFAVTGVVRWRRERIQAGPDAPEGCGIGWTSLDPKTLAAIQVFVRGRDTLFYEE
jgi:uncharacterized protein (TIGR02266 family)